MTDKVLCFFSCSTADSQMKLVVCPLLTHHVLELHNCPKNLECELSFSTGTFLNITDNMLNRKKKFKIYSGDYFVTCLDRAC